MLILHVYDVIRVHPFHFTLFIEIVNLLGAENVKSIAFLKKDLKALIR